MTATITMPVCVPSKKKLWLMQIVGPNQQRYFNTDGTKTVGERLMVRSYWIVETKEWDNPEPVWAPFDVCSSKEEAIEASRCFQTARIVKVIAVKTMKVPKEVDP